MLTSNKLPNIMQILIPLKEILKYYIQIYKLADISKFKFFLVIFLTMITVALDALGVGILLPIGEYILNYNQGEIPETNSWKILSKLFSFISIQPSINLIVSITIVIILIRQVCIYNKAVLLQVIRHSSILKLRKFLFKKFLIQDIYYIKI